VVINKVFLKSTCVEDKRMNIKEAFQLATDHYQTGNYLQAEHLIKEILKVYPDNAEALYFLGIIYVQLKKYNLAIQYLDRSLQFSKANPEVYLALGTAFQQKRQYDEAIQCYQKTISLDPINTDALNLLGNIFQEKGQLDEVIDCYKKVIQINPSFYEAYISLGKIYQEKGQFDEAVTFYQKAIQLNPNHPEAYHDLGLAFLNRGQFDIALHYFHKTLQLNRNSASSYNNIGLILKEKGNVENAVHCYQKAIELNPNYAEAYYRLGNALFSQGKYEQAFVAYDKASNNKSHHVLASWMRCMSRLSIIYPDESSIYIGRKLYHDELVKLQNTIPLETQQDISISDGAVGTAQPFYLAYQGLNDRELQQLYGELVYKIMTFRYPQFVERPTMPSYLAGEPFRVGFVSGFFNLHSNWKIPIKGWVENIDKQRFRLFGYYTGKEKDKETEVAIQYFNKFIEDIYSFEELCQIIRNDNLHLLIYPEIGMNPKSIRLAALRLAPIQCTSWGHPDTSGLPTIDYFLSSDLMEPADADEHYTEKLIRLPNLSIYYTPLDFPPVDINRETFGIRQKSVLYLCCQSLFKYLPQYDEIYPRIAKEVGDCQFLFISHHESNYVTEQFRKRIYQSFKMSSMRADNYIVFLPRLDIGQYNAINSLSDIYLDSIGWSGCNSTFEAIVYNLPIVTLPGKLMRGRHTSAILTMMGVMETIASTQDEYVELAVRLGVDSEWRKQISDKIATNKHRVYRDKTCITALEDFLERIVKEEFM
jgi:protein O-GlcNAc transferase